MPNKTNLKVDKYVDGLDQWQREVKKLRTILLSVGLEEDLKWGKPCYSYDGGNIAIIQSFKNECRLMFFKGALLKDKKKILQSQGENTRSALVVKFNDVKEINKLSPTLKEYLKEAIVLEEAGAKVEMKPSDTPEIPEELKRKFSKDTKFKTAFNELTPGRQRAYIIFIAGAKQSKTREDRIAKYEKKILAGKGIND